MSKAAPFQITPTNIIALWQLISITKRYDDIPVRSALEIVLTSTIIAGGSPADQGLRLGLSCKLLEIDDEQKLISSQYCKKELHILCDTEAPNVDIIRGILYRCVSLQNLDWLLFFNDDADLFKALIPNDWIELLENANLFDFENDLVRDWWGQVFSKFQTYKEGQKIEIGKVAEKLTYDFERNRLQKDGHDSGPAFVKWASQITDKYGYDILSIRGTRLKFFFNEKNQIQIEVKSSVSSNEKEFRFYVTKNEWNTASKNIDSYYFYCWTSTSKEKESATGPFIIPADALSSHIPTDNGNFCEWSECRFVVNLDSLKL
jgi:hypothetical protein